MRSTKNALDGKAIPESCIYPNGCEMHHCHDCAFVGKERVMEWLEKLNMYENAFSKVINSENKDTNE